MLVDEISEENFVEKRKEGVFELEKKFVAWDNLKADEGSISEWKERAARLFRDPTVWAYATLQDKEGGSLRLYPFQDRLINDGHRFIHVTAANQVGKTWGAGIIKGLHHAIHVDNASVMLISSKESQAVSILDEMKWMMRRSHIPFDEMMGEVKNRTELHIEQGGGKVGVIRTFPPTTSILGYPSTLTIMDETGFWAKESDLSPIEYYQQCVEPRSNATKNWKHSFLTMGQIIGITNPNGQQGLAWELENDPRFHKYHYCWLANPHNTLREYREAKGRLPAHRFASVFEATYYNVQGGFITSEQFDTFAGYEVPLMPDISKSLFLGGDFASEEAKYKGTDWNVLYGVQVFSDGEGVAPKIKVVYRKVWPPGTKKSIIYTEIERLRNTYSIGMFGYDKIGVGDKIKTDLVERGILSSYKIEPLTYSLPNKSEVYLNFQSLFESGLIRGRSDLKKLREQILGLQVTQADNSIHLKIHHKTEGLKDDEPDALANACYVARVLKNATPGVIVLKREKVVGGKKYLHCCPVCEKEGKDPYFMAVNDKKKHLVRKDCPRHQNI